MHLAMLLMAMYSYYIWSCYFLLNYALVASVALRPLSGLSLGSLLFSFELCWGEKATVQSYIRHPASLLFSFELCCNRKAGSCSVESMSCACYFLLNYALHGDFKIQCEHVQRGLAIFFWIMLQRGGCSLGCLRGSFTCYFLLNYACRVSRRTRTVKGADLAIFFWIMLNFALKCEDKDCEILSCYFLLNYAA